MTQERSSRRMPSPTAQSPLRDASDANSVPRQLRRRRDAARRYPPLPCGCDADPALCRCTWPPLSEKIDVLQALWCRGGDDRLFAARLYELTDGYAA